MRIAVVGWGSLIWNPGGLNMTGRWRPDGPHLPVEFARRSSRGRLTLAIEPSSEEQPTYWAVLGLTQLDEARSNLREREGARYEEAIKSVRRADRDITGDAIAGRIRRWMDAHPDIDAVMWTGLASTLTGTRASIIAQAVAYLRSLDVVSADYANAREYVVKTPPQVQTAVRREMRAHGWADEPAPPGLIEGRS